MFEAPRLCPVPRRLLALALIGTAAAAPLTAIAAGWDWYLDGPASILLAVVGGYAAGALLSRALALAAVLTATAVLVITNQLHDVSYHWRLAHCRSEGSSDSKPSWTNSIGSTSQQRASMSRTECITRCTRGSPSGSRASRSAPKAPDSRETTQPSR